MKVKVEMERFTTGGLQVLLHNAAGVYLYTARVVNVVGTRVLLNRFSETEVCCHGRRKRYREVVELEHITKVDGNKVYIK